MVSKQEIPVAGLLLTVYGLEEYKAKVNLGPAAVMFVMHGRLQKRSAVEHICQALCGINDNGTGKRHLIVVTFDHPNHGSRLVNKLSNFGWKEGRYENPTHAQDMWSMFYSSSQTVSALIDVLESYLFGPQEHKIVEKWGVLGFSMGGHASFLAAANDPRISVAIPIVGTADFIGLMKDRLTQSSLDEKAHLPKPFVDMVQERTANLDQKLKSTKLLMISGEKDKLVPGAFNKPFVERLRKCHQGTEGKDWEFVIVPNVGHEWCPSMVNMSVAWCEQWMVKKQPLSTFALAKSKL